MTEEMFINFLNRHQALGYNYKRDGLAGLINVWYHKDKFILTWEECKDGDQFNESNYTRDERHEFSYAIDVTLYLRTAGMDVTVFML